MGLTASASPMVKLLIQNVTILKYFEIYVVYNHHVASYRTAVASLPRSFEVGI